MTRSKRYNIADEGIPADTPSASTSLRATGSRTKVDEVKMRVESEIQDNCHVAETEAFLQKFFPIDDDVLKEVLEGLIASKAYDTTHKQWANIPTKSKNKSKYYEPFVKAAEAIRRTKTGNDKYSCMWLTTANKAPASLDKDAALIRPDVLSILGSGEDTKYQEGSSKGSSSDERLREAIAWWLRVHVVVEIKPTEAADALQHIIQLVGYLRQVLREQVDRRFVPGLLLCQSQLSVWIADRSGILGTQKTFNIHTEPKLFIQVILGCSILAPEKLGWDNSMRLLRQPITSPPRFIPSYDALVTFTDYRESIYERHWLIEMPSKADPKKRECFLTIRALSVVRAASISGRATMVWAVMKASDVLKPPPHKIYVLKQSWRSSSAASEGSFYHNDTEYVSQIYSFEDVQDSGCTVDTQSYIRKNLKHYAPTSPPLNKNAKREAEQVREAEQREPYLLVTADNDERMAFESTSFQDPTFRIQSRVVMEDFGFPIHQFRDLPELLRVLKHFFLGHRALYFKGTLQRDVSLGNILICPVGDGLETKGRLIDFDNAKTTRIFNKEPLLKKIQDETVNVNREYLAEYWKLKEPFEDDLIRIDRATNVKVSEYLKDCRKVGIKLQGTTDKISGRDLGLFDANHSKLPNFSECDATENQRSATLAFGSPEVLSGKYIYGPNLISAKPFVHDAIHDLEALFWAVSYICLTRQGPGGQRRQELMPGNTTREADKTLALVNYYLFSCNDVNILVDNKTYLFAHNDYERYVVSNFHPYFEPLKPLLIKWWEILLLAYRYPIFEATHDWFIAALDETIAKVGTEPSLSEASIKVDEARKSNLDALRSFSFPAIEGEKRLGESDLSPTHESWMSARSTAMQEAPVSPLNKKPRLDDSLSNQRFSLEDRN